MHTKKTILVRAGSHGSTEPDLFDSKVLESPCQLHHWPKEPLEGDKTIQKHLNHGAGFWRSKDLFWIQITSNQGHKRRSTKGAARITEFGEHCCRANHRLPGKRVILVGRNQWRPRWSQVQHLNWNHNFLFIPLNLAELEQPFAEYGVRQ